MLARSYISLDPPFVPLDAFQRLPAEFPFFADVIPPGTISAGAYECRFAQTRDDLLAVQRLRFDVFFNKDNIRSIHAPPSGIDDDGRDQSLHHLMICHRDSGAVVGTYRLQTAPMAASRYGFYSESLFELGAMPDSVLEHAVEVGRACVSDAHRNGRVLRLLWRGIARYLQWNDKRFLFGCCSIPGVDLYAAINAWRILHARAALHDRFLVPPRRSAQALPDNGRAKPLATIESLSAPLTPLFDSYLGLGAKVCSAPAVDRQFGTTDFLVLLDIRDLDRRTFRSLFG